MALWEHQKDAVGFIKKNDGGKRLSQARLHQLLKYNPETGIFTRKKAIKGGGAEGAVVGWSNKIGYLAVQIDGQKHYCHRLAWLYSYGYLPEHNIDHINRNKKDNRIKNLREISQQCNTRNNGNRKNNSSGVKGVSWNTTDKVWVVQITANWKNHRIGGFKDFEEAVCHRLAAEQCLGWSGCDSNSPAYQAVQKMLRGKIIRPKNRSK
jgi:hypothetical protein